MTFARFDNTAPRSGPGIHLWRSSQRCASQVSALYDTEWQALRQGLGRG